jgi:hypothetical protein
MEQFNPESMTQMMDFLYVQTEKMCTDMISTFKRALDLREPWNQHSPLLE